MVQLHGGQRGQMQLQIIEVALIGSLFDACITRPATVLVTEEHRRTKFVMMGSSLFFPFLVNLLFMSVFFLHGPSLSTSCDGCHCVAVGLGLKFQLAVGARPGFLLSPCVIFCCAVLYAATPTSSALHPTKYGIQ